MSSFGLQSSVYDGPAVPNSYLVVRPIGGGSYGEVWLAEDAVGKRVAVKIVDRDRLGHSSMREERALRLAALLTRERRAATAAANALVLRACDADPQRRFRSAEEFIDALDKAQRPLKPRRPVSKARRAAILATMLLPSLLIGGAMLSGRSSGAAQAPDSWRSLFDGETMSGWFCDRPDVDGTWFVQNGALTAERDRRYKTLASEEVFDYGSFRAEVIPGHDGARLGLMFGGPRGSLFVLMGDKYTWISGDKNPKIYEQPGSWRSFPGPIPPSGEPVLMEVDWGPDRCRLFINGEFLQEVPRWPKTGNLSLHIWADDTGSFREIAYRRPPAGSYR
jgi:hypothetical protein